MRTKSAILAFRAKMERLQMDAVYNRSTEYREQEQNIAVDCKAFPASLLSLGEAK